MNETIRLYDDAPYETEFDAQVLSVLPGSREGTADVVLDRTLFFPEEGGQTPDCGTMEGMTVEDVQIRNGVITHTVLTGDGELFAEGSTVHGRIDWEHRFGNMQNHTGEHILSGLLHNIYGYENVGFRLSDNTVTLDTSGQLDDEQILDLERRANRVVFANVPVICEYPDPAALAAMEYRSKKDVGPNVRVVTIEGVDRCACCAPHVRRTGEIGLIRIIDVLHTRKDMRLTIVCGERAVGDLQKKTQQLREISHMTNLPQERAADGVRHFKEEIAGLKEKIRAMQQRYADMRLQEILAQAGDNGLKDCWVFEDELDPAVQRHFMNRLLEHSFRYVGVFAGSDTDGWSYVIGSRTQDSGIPGRLLKERFGARGGGKPVMIQGSVKAAETDLMAAFGELA